MSIGNYNIANKVKEVVSNVVNGYNKTDSTRKTNTESTVESNIGEEISYLKGVDNTRYNNYYKKKNKMSNFTLFLIAMFIISLFVVIYYLYVYKVFEGMEVVPEKKIDFRTKVKSNLMNPQGKCVTWNDKLSHTQLVNSNDNLWLNSTTDTFNPEAIYSENLSDSLQNTSEMRTEGEYGDYITSLVADEKTKRNQAKWAEEVRPFSRNVQMIDNLDEAMEASTHFVGLRRPQSVAQHDPMLVTERDSSTFANNRKFNFKG